MQPFFSRTLWLALVVSFTLAGCAREPLIRDRRVLVMDFESAVAEPGVPGGAALAELMEQTLVNQPRISVIPRRGQGQLMQKVADRQMTPADLGARVDADYVVVGSMTRVGGNYVLNARLVSTDSGRAVNNSSVSRACRQERDIYPLVQAVAKGSAWQLKVLAEFADQIARGDSIELPAFAREGQR